MADDADLPSLRDPDQATRRAKRQVFTGARHGVLTLAGLAERVVLAPSGAPLPR